MACSKKLSALPRFQVYDSLKLKCTHSMNQFIMYRTLSPITPTPPDYSRDYSSSVDWIKYSTIKFEKKLEELKKLAAMEEMRNVLEGFQKVHDETDFLVAGLKIWMLDLPIEVLRDIQNLVTNRAKEIDVTYVKQKIDKLLGDQSEAGGEENKKNKKKKTAKIIEAQTCHLEALFKALDVKTFFIIPIQEDVEVLFTEKAGAGAEDAKKAGAGAEDDAKKAGAGTGAAAGASAEDANKAGAGAEDDAKKAGAGAGAEDAKKTGAGAEDDAKKAG